MKSLIYEPLAALIPGFARVPFLELPGFALDICSVIAQDKVPRYVFRDTF